MTRMFLTEDLKTWLKKKNEIRDRYKIAFRDNNKILFYKTCDENF